MVPRRKFLAGIGGAIPLLLVGHFSDDDRDAANDGPSDGFPEVSIEADKSSKEHIRMSAELLQQFDADTPARIRITLRNDSDERREFAFGVSPPFYDLNAQHPEGDGWLYLQPVGEDGTPTVDEPVDGCWQIDSFAMFDVVKYKELNPDETLTNEYDIYSATEGDCLAEGTYRFEDSTVGEVGHRWGLSVTLTYP